MQLKRKSPQFVCYIKKLSDTLINVISNFIIESRFQNKCFNPSTILNRFEYVELESIDTKNLQTMLVLFPSLYNSYSKISEFLKLRYYLKLYSNHYFDVITLANKCDIDVINKKTY
jgi:hypothetical protein